MQLKCSEILPQVQMLSLNSIKYPPQKKKSLQQFGTILFRNSGFSGVDSRIFV